MHDWPTTIHRPPRSKVSVVVCYYLTTTTTTTTTTTLYNYYSNISIQKRILPKRGQNLNIFILKEIFSFRVCRCPNSIHKFCKVPWRLLSRCTQQRYLWLYCGWKRYWTLYFGNLYFMQRTAWLWDLRKKNLAPLIVVLYLGKNIQDISCLICMTLFRFLREPQFQIA